MIKLSNVNKYYNKSKSNEIHVLNNVSLDLPEKGLIALLGKSGCGKTTLLNAMSGLDNTNNGLIEVDGTTFKSYNAKKWDKVRSSKIGYVFQNYYLFNEKSVFENLEMALNLAGLYDKKEIDERITYALSLVGLEKYKKRKPSTLSGGQQQRVGIARAIVKSPSVIIADEPTGNLDSKNTFEIMDTLKSISKYCLVVLVTHEYKIAEFFADRIIKMSDGKIIDDTSVASELSLDVRERNHIYLKDLQASKGELFGTNIEYFYKDKPLSGVEIKLIELDGRIYLKASSADTPITLLDEKSETKLLDESYKAKSNIEHRNVNIDRNILGTMKTAKGNAIKTSVALRNAFKRYFSIKAKKKFFGHLILAASAFLFVLALAFGANTFIFDKSTYEKDTRILKVFQTTTNTTLGEAKTLIGTKGIEAVLLINAFIYVEPIAYELSEDYYSSNTIGGNIIEDDFYPYSLIKGSPKLIEGNKATPSEKEAVIDIKTANQAIQRMKLEGINQIDFLIGEKVRYSGSGGDQDFTIVGIVDSGVSGIWIDTESYETLLASASSDRSFALLSSNKALTKKAFDGHIIDEYEMALKEFEMIKKILGYTTGIITIVVAFIVISATRRNAKAGFIDRVKDIGTYRCIGASKMDVSKEFIFENILTTTMSSFIGFVLGSYFVKLLASIMFSLTGTNLIGLYYPIWLMLLTVIFIYAINVFISVTKINKLMLSTPAQIMTKYDI